MSFPSRRHFVLAMPGLLLAACTREEPPAAVPAAAAPPPEPAPAAPDATIEITNWQLGMIGKVAWGSGTLIYRGQRLPFRLRALGAGGVGMARIRATGEVFNMPDVSRFPGVYAQARAGVVVPGAEMSAPLWLQNTEGVRLRLQPRRTGLALQLGADGVLIEMR